MMTIQNYKKAESLEEAWQLYQKRGNRVLGGMLWLKQGSLRIATAIDLSGLGLDTITETEEEYRLGSMVTLRTLERHAGLNAATGGAFKEALRHIVGVQFRNLATLGGSIYGRYGFSDVLTLLLAMDTTVVLYKGNETTVEVPLAQFAASGYERDIVVELRVKKAPASYYYRAVRIAQTDLPVLTCAAVKQGEKVSLVVGARPARAVRIEDEQGILKNGITAESAAAFGEWAAEKVPAGGNNRGSAAYRSHLVKTLAEEAAATLGGIELC